MQMCDPILVVDQGDIVEDKTFERPIEMKDVFAGGGEWLGE
jgi:ABC-type multidrug transport system fused ATPase/permease subunit